MKRSKRNAGIIPFLLFISLCFLPSLGHTAIVSVVPSTSIVGVGSTFTISINVSDVSDLYGYQFTIGFNPAVLSALDATEGPFLLSGGSTFYLEAPIDNSTGTIAYVAASLLGQVSGVSGSGTLATISFQAIAAGTSSIDLSGVQLLNSGLQTIVATSVGGTVNVPTTLAADFTPSDCDVDGSDLAVLIANTSLINLTTFAQEFGKNVCQ